MAHVGEPIRRFVVIPMEEPITAPEGPRPRLPEKQPVKKPQRELEPV